MQPLPIDGMIILIFLPDVTPTVLEIIRTQNRNFECVRRETKKEKKRKKGKLATRYINALCFASH